MAESGSPTPRPPKKEFSMEQRLLLTFVLMGLVLLVSQYFFKPQSPSQPTVQQKEAPKPAQQSVPPPPAAPFSATGQPTAQVAAEKEETYRIETDVYSIIFSNRGAQVRSWILKKYKTSNDKPLELVNQPGAEAIKQYPLALSFPNTKLPLDVNNALYVATPATDRPGVDYEFSNGTVTVRKRLRFTRNSYLSQITTEVLNNGVPVPHLITWRAGFGDPSAANALTAQQTVYYDAGASKLIMTEAGKASDGPVGASGNYTFAGLQDAYFAAVFLPRDGNNQVEIQTLADSVKSTFSEEAEPHIGAAVGGKGLNRFALFVGPKDVDLLRSVDRRLEQIVDFGTWFGFLAKPLFTALNWVNDKYVHNYGWSIIIVTVIINLLLVPLRISSMKSMKKMSSLQPEIAKINEKYKGIGMRDPRKAQQNEELMALYKKHGVNPIGGGCFPVLLQLPFFIAFYTVLTVAIEMRGAQWLWIKDLSHYDPLYLLPILMIGTQFIVQKMTPVAGGDPMQQKMMAIMMPLMMGIFFMKASAGLVLYWLTGNVVSMAQQWFFNRLAPAPAPAVIDVKPVKKSRK